ncbi:pyridoxamine 5'-phosphate oxidase family protein [Carnimonas nigrificans]|uniref:pyridoxamine 5'-phosphate oxidase family protein n=1 Tax=Carnimonas nigrificans TaxID=64323 RepID=UPI00047139EB|nr:pyridoxamine 5'-phosphate oxidase family protein [Carnimonas nigrificans]
MNKLTDAMKQMLAKQLPIQATVGADGLPDIGPKRSLRVYDDHTLIYNENTGGQTLTNIRNGSKIAVAVIDREALDGFRFIGEPEIFTSGEPYQNALEFARNNGMKEPKCAVLIHIGMIYTLKSGPTAGARMDQ